MKQRNHNTVPEMQQQHSGVSHMFMGEVMMAEEEMRTKTLSQGHFVIQGNGQVSIVQCKVTKVSKQYPLAHILTSYWNMGSKNNKKRTKVLKREFEKNQC